MKSPLFLVLAVLLTTQVAMAKEYEQDPFKDNDFVEKPVLQNKAHPMTNRLELGLNYTNSMVEKFMVHRGFAGTVGWHFHDTFAVELYGGYMVGKRSTLYQTVEAKVPGSDLNLPSSRKMTWITDVVLKWTPIYGKINIVSELAIRANFYLLFGAGANGTRLDYYQTATAPEKGVSFNFQWGAGGQIFVTKWMAIRLEYRDIDFLDKWESKKPTTSGNPAYTALSMNHMFHVGLSFFPF